MPSTPSTLPKYSGVILRATHNLTKPENPILLFKPRILNWQFLPLPWYMGWFYGTAQLYLFGFDKCASESQYTDFCKSHIVPYCHGNNKLEELMEGTWGEQTTKSPTRSTRLQDAKEHWTSVAGCSVLWVHDRRTRGWAGYTQNPCASKAWRHHHVPELQMLLLCPSPALGRGKWCSSPKYLLWSYRKPSLLQFCTRDLDLSYLHTNEHWKQCVTKG